MGGMKFHEENSKTQLKYSDLHSCKQQFTDPETSVSFSDEPSFEKKQ